MTKVNLDTDQFSVKAVGQLKEDFVGNECGSDEYRETQPTKGIEMTSRAFRILEDRWTDSRLNNDGKGNADVRFQYGTLQRLFKTWVAATGTWYDGCEELVPVLEIVFDVLWSNNEHPYNECTEDLQCWLEECYPGVDFS